MGAGGRCDRPILDPVLLALQVTELRASPGSRRKVVTTVRKAPGCGNDSHTLNVQAGSGCCHARVEILNVALGGQSSGTASSSQSAT